CTSDPQGTALAEGSPLMIGLDADPALLPVIDRVQLRVTDDAGAELFAEAVAGPLPVELAIPALEIDLRITIDAEAIDAGGAPIVTRTLATRYPSADASLLARLRFNDECVPGVTGRDVSCPGDTCVAGVCRPPFVSTTDLETYRSDWEVPPPNLCPAADGDVAVTIGDDADDFSEMAADTLLIPEPGNQGGTHVWLSVRATHLVPDPVSGEGMLTYITLDGPAEGATPAQRDGTAYVADGDTCRLRRVRYILSDDGEWNTMQRLRVHVVDAMGNAGFAGVDVAIGEPG
ncbi:MAG: hypothetical protein RIF41_02770, partial [Polyangiaceae bacterium]